MAALEALLFHGLVLLPHLGVGPVCWEPGGGHHCDRPGREWPYTCAPGTGKTQIVCRLIRGLDGNLT